MYAWEKNWSCFQDTFSVGSPGGTLSARQSVVQRLKNWMVSHAGWTVVASKGFWPPSYNYEYEGVTPGGSYGGDSTGPYDVWYHSGGDIGATRIPWVMLRSPASAVGTFYVLFGYDGTDANFDSSFYFGVSDQMFLEPVGNALPLPAPGAGYAARPWADAFYSGGDNATYYLYFSGCVEDGSFVLSVRRHTHTVVFSGVYLFSVLDPAGASYDNCMPITFMTLLPISGGYTLSSPLVSINNHYLSNWEEWTKQTPKVRFQYRGDTIAGVVRYVTNFVNVGTTDFPLDMDGKVYMYPAHVLRTATVGYSQDSIGGDQPARTAYVGRMKDFYIAPDSGVVKGDVVIDGEGAIRYYYLTLFYASSNTDGTSNFKIWVPGTEVPA